MKYLLPQDQIEEFKGVVFVREGEIFYRVTDAQMMSAKQFDDLHAHWLGFWIYPDNTHGKVKRASVAFRRNTHVAFPQVDRLIVTEQLPGGTMGVDAFGYSYITKFGKR